MSEAAQALKKPVSVAIEDLLKPQARVLYENIFSTRHIGRVVDFFLHECRLFVAGAVDAGYTEYRIRHAIELAVFNAWSNYRKGEKAKCVEVELGWDDERLVLAVSHYVDGDVTGFAPGAEPSNATAGRIQKMLEKIQALGDGMAVRHQPKTGRVQVVVFVLPKSGAEAEAGAAEYHELDEAAFASQPRADAAEPAPLSAGDVDAFNLDEKSEEQQCASGRKSGKAGPADDDWLSKAAKNTDASDATVGSIGPSVDDVFGDVSVGKTDKLKTDAGLIKVKGSGPAQEDSAVYKVSGGGAVVGSDVQKVKRLAGSMEARSFDMTTKAAAGDVDADSAALLGVDPVTGAPTSDDGGGALAEQVGGTLDAKEADESIQVILDTIKSEVVPLCPGLTDDQFQEAFRSLSAKIRENFTQTLHHLLRVKNIQTITKVKYYRDQMTMLSAKVDELKAEKHELNEALAEKDSVEAEILKLKDSADQQAYHDARAKQESKLHEEVVRYQGAVEKGEVPAGAKGWAKGFMEAMLKERASVNQRMRQAEEFLRKREHEFKTKETSLKQTLRIKEELMRQKDFSLTKTKETLTNTLATLEQSRGAGGGSDVGQKLSTVERLLAAGKENNERLQKRSEELQKKWHEEFTGRSALQTSISKLRRENDDLVRKLAEAGTPKDNGATVAQVSQERDRALKIIDELKRQIKQLQAKVTTAAAAVKAAAPASTEAKRAVATDVEMKHKLEHANKMVKATKEELDRARKKFEEVKQEETKLRVEVGRLTAQLKAVGKAPVVQGRPPGPPAQKSSQPNKSPLIGAKPKPKP